MEFDFGIVHRLGMYHGAADAMSGLPQTASEAENGNADIDDKIATYCIVGETCESNDAPKPNKEIVAL